MRIRNEFQEGMSVKEIAIKNQKYLRNHTNYLSRHKLNEYFKNHFNNVIFGERHFLKYLRRVNYLYNLSAAIPLIPNIYGSFRSNIIITRSPKSGVEPPPL